MSRRSHNRRMSKALINPDIVGSAPRRYSSTLADEIEAGFYEGPIRTDGQLERDESPVARRQRERDEARLAANKAAAAAVTEKRMHRAVVAREIRAAKSRAAQTS